MSSRTSSFPCSLPRPASSAVNCGESARSVIGDHRLAGVPETDVCLDGGHALAAVDAHPTLQLRRAVERPQDGVVALVGSTDSPPFEAEAGRAGDSALTARGRYTQLVA